LILKAADVGLGVAYVPAVLVVMNVAYALSAYPAGWLSDRMNRWGVFAVGAALLIAADLVLAFGASVAVVGVGVALWGLHMGFTQGLLAALVADTASAAQRGTAFGVFNLVTGLALLVASVLAGLLWDRGGPALTFLAGAALTAAAGVVAIALYWLKKIDGRSALG
jgi:MFS family permease